jgi:uncharacterized phiE125 gp8 family phage protein
MRLNSPRYGETTGLQTKVTVKPVNPVVTVTEAKNWARISGNAEDTLITDLIETATKQIESHYNLSLISQTRIAFWESYGEEVSIPYGPHQSITTVERIYQGTSTTLTSSDYHTDGLDYLNIYPNTVYRGSHGRVNYNLKITYVSGFGADGSDVPEDIRKAVSILVAHLYEYRQEFRDQSNKVMSGEVDRLMQAYSRREWI